MIADLAEIMTLLGIASNASPQQIGIVTMLHPMVEQAILDLIHCGSIEQTTYTHFLPARSALQPRDVFLDQVELVGDRVVSSWGLYTVGDRLQLPEIPVRSVASVYEDRNAWNGQYPNAFAANTIINQGTDFCVDWLSSTSPTAGFPRNGQLVRISSVWPNMPRSVKVTYTAGYARSEIDTPGPISALPVKQAVIEAMAISYVQTLALQSGATGAIKGEHLGHESYDYDTDDSAFKVVVPKSARKKLQRYVNYARLVAA